jgi:hypothetical protein
MNAKTSKSKTTKQAKSRIARARVAPVYEVVGTTSDGVKILRGKTKPTHFTSKEIRKTIGDLKRSTSPRS